MLTDVQNKLTRSMWRYLPKLSLASSTYGMLLPILVFPKKFCRKAAIRPIVRKIRYIHDENKFTNNKLWRWNSDMIILKITFLIFVTKSKLSRSVFSILHVKNRSAVSQYIQYTYIVTIYTIYVHCQKISNLFVQALETGRKPSLWLFL
jgi:hypothetical protein